MQLSLIRHTALDPFGDKFRQAFRIVLGANFSGYSSVIGTAGAAITVDTRASKVVLPVVGGDLAALASGAFADTTPPVLHLPAPITADATLPGGLGSFGFDDEGVPAERTVVIEDGIFQNFISSRETAPVLGPASRSSGAMRADGWRCAG